MAGYKGKIINSGNDAKTIKGNGDKYETAIFYGKSYKQYIDGKEYNTCSMAKIASCFKGCLYSAGRGKFNNVQQAIKQGVKPCVRLNGTTDIQWEKIKVIKDGIEYENIFSAFPNIQFYDYTKIFKRDVSHIKNYHLTWSYSEANQWYANQYKTAIKNGMNIAVVFRDKNLPKKFLGLKVIDGDKDDLRFLDPENSIVGLYAKGDARKDTSGFVID
jgi:hypothetical protein